MVALDQRAPPMALRRRATGLGAHHLVSPVGLGHRLEPVARVRRAPRGRTRRISGDGTGWQRRGAQPQSRPLSPPRPRAASQDERWRPSFFSIANLFPFAEAPRASCESHHQGENFRVVRHSTGAHRSASQGKPQGGKIPGRRVIAQPIRPMARATIPSNSKISLPTLH